MNEGTPKPDDIDVGETIRSALEEISSYADARRVSMEPSLDANLRARMVPEEVKTVVSNLAMNAIQHSSQGSSVRVAARVIGPSILVMVQDSGTGISTENLPRVFERFFREDASRSRETGGAGLGLSICKAIVEKAGGSIEIESERGKGTIVKVRLPQSQASLERF
jgi:signal transduction histidine kinase